MTTLNVALSRGNSYAMLVDLLDGDGAPLPASDVEHVDTRYRWTISTAGGTSLLTRTLADGLTLNDPAATGEPYTLLVALTAEQSASLPAGWLRHELKILLPDEVVDTLVEGTLLVSVSVIGATVT